MEPTLLPDGASSTEINIKIDSKSHDNYLTSSGFGAMNMVVNKKEEQ